MTTTRREFLAGVASAAGSAAGLAALGGGRLLGAKAAAVADLRVGVCDWSLGLKGAAALKAAGKIQLEGVQISPRGAGDKLSYSSDKEQKEYKDAVKATGVQVASVGLTLTNRYPLATDPRGAAWLVQTIDAANALGCKATLLAFFGRGNLRKGKTLKKKEVDSVVAKLKEAAPRAKEKGVALGIENTLSAKDNAKILDRIGSDFVQVYYDIANSTNNGFDVPAEIRTLKGRICEFHFKNTKGLFGQSGVKLGPIAESIRAIGFKGWLILERSFGKDRMGYFQKNGEYIRKVFGLKTPATKA